MSLTMPATSDTTACLLCNNTGGREIWRSHNWRVIHADSEAEASFPVFYRLICNAHYEEWSDLPASAQHEGMGLLTCIEAVMRQQLQPLKVNLASLGNVVPHLHWHIVGRYDWDSHYPSPVWAEPRRSADAEKITALRARLAAFEAALIPALSACQSTP